MFQRDQRFGVFFDAAFDLRLVGAGVGQLRVEQARPQLGMRRHDEQSFGVPIEPTDRPHSGWNVRVAIGTNHRYIVAEGLLTRFRIRRAREPCDHIERFVEDQRGHERMRSVTCALSSVCALMVAMTAA